MRLISVSITRLSTLRGSHFCSLLYAVPKAPLGNKSSRADRVMPGCQGSAGIRTARRLVMALEGKPWEEFSEGMTSGNPAVHRLAQAVGGGARVFPPTTVPRLLYLSKEDRNPPSSAWCWRQYIKKWRECLAKECPTESETGCSLSELTGHPTFPGRKPISPVRRLLGTLGWL